MVSVTRTTNGPPQQFAQRDVIRRNVTPRGVGCNASRAPDQPRRYARSKATRTSRVMAERQVAEGLDAAVVLSGREPSHDHHEARM